MDEQKIVSELVEKNETKIILIVLDGLGGLPVKDEKSELEFSKTPNLDELARESATGLHIPVFPGISPGSGPGHLSIFGYDPIKWEIGRGLLEALGIGLNITDRDIAIRTNYATVKEENGRIVVVDRRAGRIPTEENRRLTKKITERIKEIDGVQIIMEPAMEYRSALILRFKDKVNEKMAMIKETDPQVTHEEVIPPEPLTTDAKRVSEILKKFLREVKEILKGEKANYLLLRGYSTVPNIPKFPEVYKLKAGCIATYPMYKGLSKLVGMEIIPVSGFSIEEEFKVLKEVYKDFDFIYFHIKKTDSYGEDGNFEKKIHIIEEFDNILPEILSLGFDVVAITGDHSTPSKMKSHSFHPVPLLIHSPYVFGRLSNRFTERECLKGELGIIKGVNLMPLLLAHARRLKKYGA
ncbi:MAG: phosphoglycerate mutase [Caldiserica bacterium]|nr:MAG: phosphoglycerate mutase [Caldisericota bacterium]